MAVTKPQAWCIMTTSLPPPLANHYFSKNHLILNQPPKRRLSSSLRLFHVVSAELWGYTGKLLLWPYDSQQQTWRRVLGSKLKYEALQAAKYQKRNEAGIQMQPSHPKAYGPDKSPPTMAPSYSSGLTTTVGPRPHTGLSPHWNQSRQEGFVNLQPTFLPGFLQPSSHLSLDLPS